MLKIVQVRLCEYPQNGRKPIRQELRRRNYELSMEALMLDEQVAHTPWEQGAESAPGRKDVMR